MNIIDKLLSIFRKKEDPNKLPKKFKKEWIKALRSGKFKQGKGVLLSCNTYCCLGVAGIVCGIPQEYIRGRSLFITYGFHTDGLEEGRKKEFEKVPKLLTGSSDNNVVVALTTMNDNGKSFKEIADYIEENL